MFVSLCQQINEIKSCRTQKYSAIFLIKIFLQTTDSMVPSTTTTVSRHTETSAIKANVIFVQADSDPFPLLEESQN